MTDVHELKPCPMCGGADIRQHAELYSEDNPSEVIGAAWVNCEACGVMLHGDWLDEAIAAWNRRHLLQEGLAVPAWQEECDNLRASTDARIAELEALIDRGQGTHGQPGYVRDMTWYSWQGQLSEARRFRAALPAAPAQAEGA